MRLKVLGSAEDALRAMTEQLIEKMNMRGISPFHLALSGAGTAQQMFGLWIREYREKIKWEQLRFYWVDERCVSPDDEESNFKHADELLFRPLDIPHAHVHRIHGEREPEVEAEHYSELVKWELPGYASCRDRTGDKTGGRIQGKLKSGSYGNTYDIETGKVSKADGKI